MKSIPKPALNHPDFCLAVDNLYYALNKERIEEPTDYFGFLRAAPVVGVRVRIFKLVGCSNMTPDWGAAWEDESNNRCGLIYQIAIPILFDSRASGMLIRFCARKRPLTVETE